MGELEAKRERMQRLVGQWRASKEPLARFARAHGLTTWRLRYWSEQFGPKRPQARTRRSRPTFAPVRVVDDGGALGAAALEIRLAAGDVIRASHELPIERLTRLIRVLRERC
jgi:hypothetical protein